MNAMHTRENKISKATLLKRLVPGTKLILTHTDHMGHCYRPRTVMVANKHHLQLKRDDFPELPEPSYLQFQSGDEFFLNETGFSVKSV